MHECKFFNMLPFFFSCQESATFQEFCFKRVSKGRIDSIFQVACFMSQDRTKANVPASRGRFRNLAPICILGFELHVVEDLDE